MPRHADSPGVWADCEGAGVTCWLVGRGDQGGGGGDERAEECVILIGCGVGPERGLKELERHKEEGGKHFVVMVDGRKIDRW